MTQKEQLPNSSMDNTCISRRDVLEGSLATVILGFCDWAHSRWKELESGGIRGEPEILDILSEGNTKIPAITEIESDEDHQFPLPDEFADVDRNAFCKTMAASNIMRRFKDELLPKYHNNRLEFIELVNFFKNLARSNPYLAEMVREIERYEEDSVHGSDPFPKIKILINDYLLPVGLYLDWEGAPDCTGEKPEICSFGFCLLEVKDVRTFEVEDDEKHALVPVAILEDGIGGFTEAGGDGKAGEQIPGRDYCILKKDNIEKYEKNMGDKDVIYDSVLRHEITHAFLYSKFPNAASSMSAPKIERFDLDVDLSLIISSRQFEAIEISEVAAFAVELAKAEIKRPFPFFETFTSKLFPVWNTYTLAKKILLPLAIMKVAKDSPLRKEALTQLENRKINFELLEEILKDRNWTLESTRIAGRLLYDFAHRAFQQIEVAAAT